MRGSFLHKRYIAYFLSLIIFYRLKYVHQKYIHCLITSAWKTFW